MAGAILYVDNVERTGMVLTMTNNTDTAHVAPTGQHAQITRLELDEVRDLPILDVVHDCIVNLDVFESFKGKRINKYIL
jgi:hypothetical protein